jgi:hypothetical protein
MAAQPNSEDLKAKMKEEIQQELTVEKNTLS